MAVSTTRTSNILFEYNEFFDFMTETDDGGLYYTAMRDVTTLTGVVWRYNLIHDIGSSWQPWNVRLFYSDGYSMLGTFHDNIIYNFMDDNAKGTMFHNVHGANIYNNIILNTGDNVDLLSTYYGTSLLADPLRALLSDTLRDGYTDHTWYTNFDGDLGEDAKGWTDARRKLYNESGLLDEDFAYGFNRFDYLRSDKFLYDVFSKGYAILITESDDGSFLKSCNKSIHNNGIVAVDGETISDFEIRLTKSIGGKNAGSHRFRSVDEMTEFMLEIGYTGAYDMSKLPDGASMFYNGNKVYTFYYNLIADGSPEAVEEWELSEVAKLVGQTDSTVTNDIDKLFSVQKSGYAHNIYGAAIFSKVAYTGQYYNNLTIDVAFDPSTELQYGNKTLYWDSIWTQHWSYSDYDGLHLQVLNENGEYTIGFIDTISDILYNDPNLLFDNEGEPVLKLLDLSEIGASLKIN